MPPSRFAPESRRVGVLFGPAICCPHNHQLKGSWHLNHGIFTCEWRDPTIASRPQCGETVYAVRSSSVCECLPDRPDIAKEVMQGWVWIIASVSKREALVISAGGYSPERAARYLGIEWRAVAQAA